MTTQRATAKPTPVDVEYLDSVLATIDRTRADARRAGQRFAFDEPWPVFVRLMRLLTPQSYGVRIQNRLAEHFGWQVVPASLDRGDVKVADGTFHEVKATMITPSNPGVNFVQIRPHQDIAGYHLFVVDSDLSLVHLWLSKEQMAGELERLGTSAHGTAVANRANVNTEWAIRFAWDPSCGVAASWVRDYGQPAPEIP